MRCEFEFGENGRPTGEANVDFATHQEAVEAMKKHKSNMRRSFFFNKLFFNDYINHLLIKNRINAYQKQLQIIKVYL